jgi:hypothetical protein
MKTLGRINRLNALMYLKKIINKWANLLVISTKQ